jgi:hypothetical protein
VRSDVLEVMAEEVAGRPVDALASFTTWDEGRRKLDGMSRGKRWDIDREQRQWERDNAADLARFVARHNWQRWMDANPEKARGAVQRWVRANWQYLLAYRARWAKEHAEQEREYDRRQMANTRKDPVRWARYLAKQERHRAKKNARARERYLANYATLPREGKRKCTLCRRPGHNSLTCHRHAEAAA